MIQTERLKFDPISHRYLLDGAVIPGITKVLELTGFVNSQWFTEESRDRGIMVHRACHYLIEGDLNWESLDPAILPRVKQFENFLETYKPELLVAEQFLVSETYRFAGTPDLYIKMNGLPTLIDIKSGKSGLAAELQTAAQGILIFENFHDTPQRFVLELPATGKWKLIPHKDPHNKTMFLNGLAMVYARINRGELKI